MAGKKRSVNGQVKVQTQSASAAQDITMIDATPPCGQPQPPSSKTTSSPSTTAAGKEKAIAPQKPTKKGQPNSKPAAQPSTRSKRQKLAKLPPNAKVSKRPLLHPALPTPFASSQHPKVLYITASSPYISALKRVRKLLAQVSQRRKQSLSAREKTLGRARFAAANGKLDARMVEREIAGEAARKRDADGGAGGGEEVYLKATGRAIPRALEIGLYFQAEADCRVRIEMGSVSAVDDVEVSVQGEQQGREEGGGGDDEIPETRLRMVSSVSVSIGLK
ncbi:Rpp20 subunit of nuclear RNase MRP and P-domain-containing protein [Bipolaris maydis]|nr:Rpp20 subunit of nuclear RNase MRP and P-domain-containing protein [Bipolaris maydis]